LANERTLLAYLRSGMALVIAGVTIIHFSQEGWFQMIGICCIPIGLVVGIIGIQRYRKMNRSISLIRRKTGSDRGAEQKGSEFSSNAGDDLQSR
jgi:putative membrane protein